MKQSAILLTALRHLGAFIVFAIFKIARVQLWIDRNVLKRYLGIETPFYKMWWKNHSEMMQRKLDAVRKMREGEPVICI